MKTVVLTLIAALAIGGVALAEDVCPDGCPTAKKVTDLNAKWDAAAKKMESLTAEQRAALAAKVADVAEACPVGCQMGPAMAVVRDVLAVAKASCDADCADCPCEKLDADSELGKQARHIKATRTAVIGQLHTLASHIANGTCADCASDCGACDEAVAKDGASKDGATCDEGACADASDCCPMQKGCPIRIASRLGALRGHYRQAQGQVANLSTEVRTKITTGFAELSKHSAAVVLVPETIAALQEGLTALHGIHGKMGAFLQANPDLVKDLPEAARLKLMVQIALVDEARLLLDEMTASMKAMHTAPAAPGASPAR